MGFRFISHVLQHGQLSIFLILILVGNLFFFLDPNLLFPTVTSVFFLSSSFGPVLLHLYMLSGTLRQNMDCCHLGKNKIRISGSVKHTGINILKQPNLSSLRVLLNCHYLVKSPSTNWFCKILSLWKPESLVLVSHCCGFAILLFTTLFQGYSGELTRWSLCLAQTIYCLIFLLYLFSPITVSRHLSFQVVEAPPPLPCILFVAGCFQANDFQQVVIFLK